MKKLSTKNFIESLINDRRYALQLAGYTYIPPVEPHYAHLELSGQLKDVLEKRGLDRFYSHQAEAINIVRKGKNVVVMTPTASGKTLIYNLPVLESIIQNPEYRALYIFPLKGLEQDQLRNFNELFEALEGEKRASLKEDSGETSRKKRGKIIKPAEIYDGDTTAYRRKTIRENIPKVIFTNPDMLHLAINPFHRKWEEFFKNLKFIIIDEIHTYRGVFGSNVAHVIRRMRRICNYWGSDPQFIAASATIANPSQLAEELTGLPFVTVSESGAPQAGKHFLFINPVESPYAETTRLFISCLKAGLRTIVFTKARKITELIYAWTLNYAPEFEDKISPYRAGFLPKERREIEQKLFNGELTGVVSTSALELGVDIGGLDCCILCGYPGSISSTWQRAGRVGRHGQESMITLVAIQDALDQYFMRHPEKFFEKSHEAAVIDPDNSNILKRHLPCASSELFLRENDTVYDMKKLMPVVEELIKENVLRPGKKDGIWFSSKSLPHREVGIRTIGEPFNIINRTGKTIGELSGFRVFREAFPGAIYLHRGKQYQVFELDLNKRNILCREVDVNYYTQALTREKTTIKKEKERKDLNRFSICWGNLIIMHQVTGYEKRRIFDRMKITRQSIEMPEYEFETEGLWILINSSVKSAIESGRFDLGGTLHAVEHALIACMPLFALCDRGDIGGLSYTIYPEFRQPAIFIYDGYEGGVGLTKRAAGIIKELMAATLKIIEECPCEEGCPSCVQDPQCGSGNQPLDKEGAKHLLKFWLS